MFFFFFQPEILKEKSVTKESPDSPTVEERRVVRRESSSSERETKSVELEKKSVELEKRSVEPETRSVEMPETKRPVLEKKETKVIFFLFLI